MQHRNLSKLQVRAELLALIDYLMSFDVQGEVSYSKINDLNTLEDKSFLLETLVKEFLASETEKKIYIISYLMLELVPKDILEQKMWELLSSATIQDKIKYYVIDILRQLGTSINYDKFVDYLNEPDEFIDIDTKKLFQSAVINPEAQIDFMDFLSSLPAQEKTLLLDSLSNDYAGDDLCNILAPVIYTEPEAEISVYAIKALGGTKSGLGVGVLRWILDSDFGEAVKSAAEISLKTLKLSGVYFDTSDAFYTSSLQGTEPYRCFSSLIDGHGNQGIVFTRMRDDGKLSLVGVVVNDEHGIIDCFGFNELSLEEFSRILERFFESDLKLEVPFSYVKTILKSAEGVSYKAYGKLRYEYICWRLLMHDVSPQLIEDVSPAKDLSLAMLKEFSNVGLFQKWFIEESDSVEFKLLLQSISQLGTLSSAGLEKLLEENFDKVFTDELYSIIQRRLEMLASLLSYTDMKDKAPYIKALQEKSEVQKEFCILMLKKSVYEFFLRQKALLKDKKETKSLFAKKNEEKSAIEESRLDELIALVEGAWCDG